MSVDIANVPNPLRGVRERWEALIFFNSRMGLQGT